MAYTNRKNGYFESCVQAVSESPYGRDVREPIAKALEMIRTGSDHDIERYGDHIVSEGEAIQNEYLEACEEIMEELSEDNQTLQHALGTVTLNSITGMTGYYQLEIRKINGQ